MDVTTLFGFIDDIFDHLCGYWCIEDLYYLENALALNRESSKHYWNIAQTRGFMLVNCKICIKDISQVINRVHKIRKRQIIAWINKRNVALSGINMESHDLTFCSNICKWLNKLRITIVPNEVIENEPTTPTLLDFNRLTLFSQLKILSIKYSSLQSTPLDIEILLTSPIFYQLEELTIYAEVDCIITNRIERPKAQNIIKLTLSLDLMEYFTEFCPNVKHIDITINELLTHELQCEYLEKIFYKFEKLELICLESTIEDESPQLDILLLKNAYKLTLLDLRFVNYHPNIDWFRVISNFSLVKDLALIGTDHHNCNIIINSQKFCQCISEHCHVLEILAFDFPFDCHGLLSLNIPKLHTLKIFNITQNSDFLEPILNYSQLKLLSLTVATIKKVFLNNLFKNCNLLNSLCLQNYKIRSPPKIMNWLSTCYHFTRNIKDLTLSHPYFMTLLPPQYELDIIKWIDFLSQFERLQAFWLTTVTTGYMKLFKSAANDAMMTGQLKYRISINDADKFSF